MQPLVWYYPQVCECVRPVQFLGMGYAAEGTNMSALSRFFDPTQVTSPALAAVQLSANVAVTAGRAVLLDVTGAGTVELTLNNNGATSNITINIQANALYEFNWAVTTLVSSGTTATLNAWVLY